MAHFWEKSKFVAACGIIAGALLFESARMKLIHYFERLQYGVSSGDFEND